jgi:alpha-amylase
MNEEAAPRVLRTVPREKTFYFFTSIGNYTGESASSLKEFMEKINEVNAKSLEFHLNRGDFEKWISEVLEDGELAGEFKRLQKINPAGDALRNQLYSIVSRRLKRLSEQSKPLRF